MRRSFALLAVLAAVLSLTAVPAAAMPHLRYRTADGAMAPLVDARLHLTRSDGGAATAVTRADGRAEGTIDFFRSANRPKDYVDVR
ncbi:hypothetical protein [Actinomadura sp. 3N407]|uniref:hypothetical protein n=1 Tax=Actinomadura sp. 3N407 TaxID=3457423 RepID=UPI003FCDDE72